MNFSKILLLLILSIFLFNGVAATMVCDAVWADETKSATITNGNSASFEVICGTMYPSMTLKVELLDSSDDVMYTFLNKNVNANEYTATYTVNSGIYGSVGNFKAIVNGVDANGNLDSDEITLKVNPAVIPTPDTTAPIITLIGSNPQTITIGNSYVEAGATASDNKDGNITSKITILGSVNTNVLGTYTLTYSVSDNAGNRATATRTVNVVSEPADTTNPTITINSPASDSVYNFTNHFLNFIASDDNLNSCAYSTDNGATRNAVSCSSGELNSISLTAVEGANTWIVYASDDSGNEASASVSFSVDTTIADTTAPTITIVSPIEKVTIKSRNLNVELTTDEDAIVTLQLDNGNLETMSNDEDHIFTYSLSKLQNGEHTLTITATDTAGNIATENVTFNVYKKSGRSAKVGNVETEVTSNEQPSIGNLIGSLAGKDVKILDEKTIKEVSLFQKAINAIVNFFKQLFRFK